jgi:hypothetical protein
MSITMAWESLGRALKLLCDLEGLKEIPSDLGSLRVLKIGLGSLRKL